VRSIVKVTAMPPRKNSRFKTALAGEALEISDHKLGAGGQASVFKGTLAGREVAVKVFSPQYVGAALASRVQEVIFLGSPDKRFVWPIDFVWQGDILAVAMPLIPKNYSTIAELLGLHVQPSFAVVSCVCFNLAEAFFSLHSRGLCYLDINRNNFQFCSRTGAIAICDNENVAINRSGYPSITTPNYMAPELGRGDTCCTITTDLHSLGVTLFEILFFAHPLHGQQENAVSCLKAEDAHRLLCDRPVFIFHPSDKSNRPDPQVHAAALRYWPIYPAFIRELFIRHFTRGIEKGHESERVREVEWRDAFVTLRYSLFECTCGAEVFFDPAAADQTCWHCARKLRRPLRLRFARNHELVLEPKATVLFPHHIGGSEYDFSKPLAHVVTDGSGKRIGIKNTSTHRWMAKHTSDSLVDVPPGATLELSPGMTIHFPTGEAHVVA